MLRLSTLFCLLFLTVGVSMAQKEVDPVKAASKHHAYEVKQKAKREKQIKKILNTAMSYYGTMYDEGGTSKRGIDAVGLTYKAYKSIGITLPLSLEQQSKAGERKYIGEIEVGDLLFFAISSGDKKLYSVSIVTRVEHGDVYFIQSTPVGGTKEYKLNDPKWKDRYILVRRIIKNV